MYKVYCDDYLLYDGLRENLKIFDAKVETELNKVGSFTFTIYQTHPQFERLKKLKSIVTVERNGKRIFRGRILNDTSGFYNQKDVSCEGELAFLLDSIQRPYEFTGTPQALFTQFINAHNSQVEEAHQFKVGNITVTDPNDYINRSDTQYLNTWDSINQKLIDTLGGYLMVRYEDDGVYIDYLAELNTLVNQTIEFGKNMIDYERVIQGEDIATAIIPLGAKLEDENGDETDERLTIEEVNGGVDYVYDEDAVETYGWIFKTVTWDDVTVASNLLTKANQELADAVKLTSSITLNAVDISFTNENTGEFVLGAQIKVKSKPHNLDDYFIISKLSLDLLNPANDQLTLGATFKTLTEQDSDNVQNIVDQVIVNIGDSIKDPSNQIAELERRLTTQIETTSSSIMTSVSEDYVTKGEYEQLVESTNTKFEQTSDSFNFTFQEFHQQIVDLDSSTTAQFEDIKKYIRFEDGDIILGESDNQLTLRIENDKLTFYDNGAQIAYFQNRKLYVYDGEFINSLRIGKFAFVPRANGNLSFKKVGD